MSYAFDLETAIEPMGSGSWSSHVSDQWSIGQNPNGGYLASFVLRAMRELSGHQDPISVAAHFLRPGLGDSPAVVNAEIVREGRSVTTVRGSLLQEGRPRLEMLAALGSLDDDPTGPSLHIEPPEIVSPQDCVTRDGGSQGVDLSLLNRIEVVLPPGSQVGGSGTAERSGWVRFSDGRPPDSLAAVLFTDAFPPSIFGKLGRVGWVPTVEMTVHVRRRPAPGWMQGHFVTEDLTDNRLIEDGSLWDSGGQLVARIRQVAMLLT